MTAHQKRVLLRLRESLELSMGAGAPLEDVQHDLDANLGIIEISEIREEVSRASNQLDECRHILGEPEGLDRARKIIAALISIINKYCESEESGTGSDELP